MKNRKKMVSILAGIMAAVMILSLLLSLIPTPASAASSREIKKQIEALKKQKNELQTQIEDVKKQFEANEDEIENMVNQKYAIDQEIVLLYDQIDNINQQLSAYTLLIADQQDELDEAEARYDALNEKNKERIRAMEEDGSVSYWAVLFKANSFSDLLDRLDMIDEIAAADKRRLRELDEAADAVVEAQNQLIAEKDEVELTKLELDATQEQLEQKQAESQELLNQLIQKGYELEGLHEKYEQDKNDLLDEIAAKQVEYEIQKELEYIAYMATYVPPTTAPPANSGSSSSGSSSSGSSSSGSSSSGSSSSGSSSSGSSSSGSSSSGSSSGESWMVPCSYRQFSSPFGPRPSPTAGASSNHQGVDLAGSRGTPIKATKSGVVTVRSSSKSAGNYVTIKHDNTYSSIYMHLENSIVSKGQVVSQGQVIGYMGDSGIVTGVHLHFGIIKNGSYVNPANYMYFHP